MKQISINDMKPFIRYARYTTITNEISYPWYIPCDARSFYVLEGCGAIETESGMHIMAKGDLLFFPPGTKYRYHTPEDYVKYAIINFDYINESSNITIPVAPMHLHEDTDNRLISQVKFYDCEELSHPIYIQKKLDIAEKMHEIIREYSQKILYHESKAGSLFAEIIIDCVREVKLGNTIDGYARIKDVLKLIHENYNQKITNMSIGKEFNLHPNYISSLIKQYTGLPLHKYILYVRISHAIDMLDTGHMSVSEVSDKCGFCDVFYFSRYFKQYMGISPNKYKNQIKY